MKRTLLYCFILFFGLTNLSLKAQTSSVSFTIYKGDDKIGDITAKRTISGKKINYSVISDATFKVIWKYNRKTDMQVEYINGELNSSISKVIFQGKLDELGQTKKVGDHYKCFLYPKDTFNIEKKITFSAAMLYFKEPVGITEIYAETYLEFCKIELESKNKYKLHLPNGKVNYYTYKGGELQEIFVDRTGFNILFKRDN